MILWGWMKIYMKMQENWVAVFFCFTRKTVKYYKMNGKVGYPPLNPFYAENFVHEGRKIILQIHHYVFSTKNRCFLGKQHLFSPYWKEIFGGTPEKNKKIVCKGRLKIKSAKWYLTVSVKRCHLLSTRRCSPQISKNWQLSKKGAAANIKKLKHVVKKVQPQILKNWQM